MTSFSSTKLTSSSAVPLASRAPYFPRKVLGGFGRSVNGSCLYVRPKRYEELLETLEQSRRHGISVSFRGAGRSYGDGAYNSAGLVIDITALNRVLSWDPDRGIIETESGATIETLWRRGIEDHFWPSVVPGTMHPTVGGCISMNVHGKNNFRSGTFSEHVLDFDLVTSRGECFTCSPETNPDLFYAAAGGLGMLGAVTRARIKMKKVESGSLRVNAFASKSLDHMFEQFEEKLALSDYLVGWVDGTQGGSGTGRGQIHQANYLHAEEDPDSAKSFSIENQLLPATLFGLPKSQLWRFMKPFLNPFGLRLINSAKYFLSTLSHGKSYIQSHVGFAFLLDYVPNWERSYGDFGFIQYQIFMPDETAKETMKQLLSLCQARGLPAYLAVLKRHRPDPFLLSYSLDGWSLAMDLKVTRNNRKELLKLTHDMTGRVLDANGKFYCAKDAILNPQEFKRAYGKKKLSSFCEIKKKYDPDAVFSSDLFRRLFV